MGDKISRDDLAAIAKENLLPTGSRVMENIGKKKVRQVYPAPHEIIKGNIAKELGWEDEPPIEEEDENG